MMRFFRDKKGAGSLVGVVVLAIVFVGLAIVETAVEYKFKYASIRNALTHANVSSFAGVSRLNLADDTIRLPDTPDGDGVRLASERFQRSLVESMKAFAFVKSWRMVDYRLYNHGSLPATAPNGLTVRYPAAYGEVEAAVRLVFLPEITIKVAVITDAPERFPPGVVR